nr:unnamed protein product [Digitaria exilis]
MVVKRRRRAYAGLPYRCDRPKRVARNKSAVLEAINGFYAAALDRLPVDEMPALVPRLLKAGLCVGFSDPVSNIITNTVSSSCSRRCRKPSISDDGKSARRRRRRRRRKALSQAVSDTTSKVMCWLPRRSLLRSMPIAERSLVALVAFLTYYFRHLPAREALEYLRLANADLLSAVRLVEEDHNSIGSFSFASRTTKTALKCAALAACHPKPNALVNRSYSVASRMDQLSQLLAAERGCLSCTTIESINQLLIKPRRKLRCLAGVTPPQFHLELIRPPPFVPTKSLKSTLIHKIYESYLKALALLPTDGLRKSYHRGLLKAGHCYGPLTDPVSNIVLNTLWYNVMFPPEGGISTATMICSRSLVQVAWRSLRGLVAYIRACFRMMSKHQAMHYLLLTDVNLWGAIEMARQQGHPEMLTQDNAYMAAATAARHPHPDTVVEFFVSTFPMMPLHMQREPSMLDVELIMQLLFECPTPNGSIQTVPVLSVGGSKFLSCILKDFREEESFVCGKVNAMLKKYTQQTRGPEYELHVICGLNSNVGDAFVFGHRRCFYCENEGAEIIHPDLEKYIGRDIDFEDMACDDNSGPTTARFLNM